MKLILIAICLFSSAAFAKPLQINEPISPNIERVLISPIGNCMNILGQDAINQLLAQDWLIDEDNLCVASVLEGSSGDCVESINPADTTKLLELGYKLLDIKSCN